MEVHIQRIVDSESLSTAEKEILLEVLLDIQNTEYGRTYTSPRSLEELKEILEEIVEAEMDKEEAHGLSNSSEEGFEDEVLISMRENVTWVQTLLDKKKMLRWRAIHSLPLSEDPKKIIHGYLYKNKKKKKSVGGTKKKVKNGKKNKTKKNKVKTVKREKKRAIKPMHKINKNQTKKKRLDI